MAKAKKNFYAIKLGYDVEKGQIIENHIATTWTEASKYVVGISKQKHGVAPEYAGFVTKEEADAYLEGEKGYYVKGNGDYPKDALLAYVDGSFSKSLQNYSYGIVYVKDEKVVHAEKGVGNNPDAVSMYQIGGELLGAMRSLLYAKQAGYKNIVIFFDYKGVANHATGVWKRDNDFSENYYQWMQKFMKQNRDITISFCKVDAHTGDEFNEIADGLAKAALNIKPDAISIRYATKHNISYLLEVEGEF